MDILKNKFGSKFKFNSTLQTDASPVRPRVNPEPVPNPTRTESSVKIEDVTDTDTLGLGEDAPPIVTDPPESPTIPPDSPPIPPLRRKAKNKSFQSNNSNPGEEKPVPPINTHASGSVINIVNSNGIHWGPEITYNFGSQPKVDPEPDPDAAIRKTKSIVVVLESKASVQHEHMDLVSKNLGAGWRSVARRMGYEDGMLDLLYESHHHKGVPEVIYQVLLDWTRTGERTLGELCSGLWKDGKRAVVRDIANLHKESPNTQSAKSDQKKFDLD